MPSFQSFKHFVLGNTQQDSIGIQRIEMADARKGIYYLLSHTQLNQRPGSFSFLLGASAGVLGFPAVLYDGLSLPAVAQQHMPVGKTLFGSGAKAANAVQAVDGAISGFFSKVVEKLASFTGPLDVEAGNFLKSVSTISLASYLGSLMARSVPGWGHVMLATSSYSAFRTVITSGYDALSQGWSSRGVKLLGGHPDIVATALVRHSLTYIAKSSKDLGLYFGMTGLSTVAGPAAPFVGALLFALLDIVSWLDSMIQRYLINKRLKEAKHVWNTRYHGLSELSTLPPTVRHHFTDTSYIQPPPIDYAPQPFHPPYDPQLDELPDHLRAPFTQSPRAAKRPPLMTPQVQIIDTREHEQFSSWLRNAVTSTPVLAALIINSGFAAHPYRFLRLLSNNGDALVSEDVFKKGEAHIANLKKISRRYLDKYSEEYAVIFQSFDPVITGMLNPQTMISSYTAEEIAWLATITGEQERSNAIQQLNWRHSPEAEKEALAHKAYKERLAKTKWGDTFAPSTPWLDQE